MKEPFKPEGEPVIQDPCLSCGKTLREQMNGCNVIYCYRQFLKLEPVIGERSAEEIIEQFFIKKLATGNPMHMASVQYFVETGKATGGLRLALNELIAAASQFKPMSSTLQERISELESRLNRANEEVQKYKNYCAINGLLGP